MDHGDFQQTTPDENQNGGMEEGFLFQMDFFRFHVSWESTATPAMTPFPTEIRITSHLTVQFVKLELVFLFEKLLVGSSSKHISHLMIFSLDLLKMIRATEHLSNRLFQIVFFSTHGLKSKVKTSTRIFWHCSTTSKFVPVTPHPVGDLYRIQGSSCNSGKWRFVGGHCSEI